ncbi:hypothetical protein AMECASPLE_018179 [Ameca splendens]|uniref:Uncharacterized protein n=1 Tax=Ameca splendens TaxID=208324 RepID=A0ABV0XRQ3_9TELE
MIYCPKDLKGRNAQYSSGTRHGNHSLGYALLSLKRPCLLSTMNCSDYTMCSNMHVKQTCQSAWDCLLKKQTIMNTSLILSQEDQMAFLISSSSSSCNFSL